MKNFIVSLLFMLLLPTPAQAIEQWQEGTHYSEIAAKASDTPEVVEYFSFLCPTCYHYEPIVAKIKQRLNANTRFNKVHVNTMGFASKEVQNAATRTMMIAREIGEEDALNLAVFKYIHLQKQKITGLNDLRRLFLINDVDPQVFDKLINSDTINNALTTNNALINANRQYITQVPTFIVNGKYIAHFSKGMKPEDFIDLVLWLSQLN